MDQSVSRKRPWLAAAFSILAAGFGHIYLRRWRRALGWLAVSFVAVALFVDVPTAEALATGTWTDDADPLSLLPRAAVMVVSTVDAYVLARAHNELARSRAAAAEGNEDSVQCPHCGRELDSDLEFCHWCTTRIDAPAGSDER